jgi:hypothetical protein
MILIILPTSYLRAANIFIVTSVTHHPSPITHHPSPITPSPSPIKDTMKQQITLLLILLSLLLSACTQEAPPNPAGPTIANLPIIEGALELTDEELPLGLRYVEQAHKETVRMPEIDQFHVEKEFIDTIEWYDDQLQDFEWKLIDVLEFGDGGFLRRYYRGQQRAIVAFHPADEGEATDFMLMQGDIR